MANDRFIRKKINRTTVECMVVDTETGVSSTIKIEIKGRHLYDDRKIRREVKSKLPSEVKLIKITGIEVTSEMRTMSEDFFIQNSKKM